MYLRLRKLDKNKLPLNGQALVAAKVTNPTRGTIDLTPVQLEWWDGIIWQKVSIVEVDDEEVPEQVV